MFDILPIQTTEEAPIVFSEHSTKEYPGAQFKSPETEGEIYRINTKQLETNDKYPKMRETHKQNMPNILHILQAFSFHNKRITLDKGYTYLSQTEASKHLCFLGLFSLILFYICTSNFKLKKCHVTQVSYC